MSSKEQDYIELVKEAELQHGDHAVATALYSSIYLREKHYFLMRIIILGAIALIVSITANVFLSARDAKYVYFATDSEGRIKELTPLNRPIQSIKDVLEWTSNAVTRSYTFSFANYREEFSQSRSNFTTEGWNGFEKALKDSGNLESVLEKKMVVTAIPVSAPYVVAEGNFNGTYMWQIEFEIIVTYQTPSEKINQPLNVRATVIRQSETKHPKGLGIHSIIAE